MYSHTYINTGFTQLSRIRSAFADAKRLSDTEPHQSAIFDPQPKTSPRGEKPAQDSRARSGGVHKKDHGTENAAIWGRGALGIGQGRLRARHAIAPTARRSMGAAFQQIHFSQHPVSLADSLRAGQACGQGERCCNCTTPCPSRIKCASRRSFPPVPMEARIARRRQNKKQSETIISPTVVCFAVSSRAARMWRRCIAGRHCPPRRSLPCPPAPARRG